MTAPGTGEALPPPAGTVVVTSTPGVVVLGAAALVSAFSTPCRSVSAATRLRTAAARRSWAILTAACRVARSLVASSWLRAAPPAFRAACVACSADFARSSDRCAARSFTTAACSRALREVFSTATGRVNAARLGSAAAVSASEDVPGIVEPGSVPAPGDRDGAGRVGLHGAGGRSGSAIGCALVVSETEPATASPRAEMARAARPCDSQPRCSARCDAT